MTVFVVLATLMTVIALAFIVLPLLRTHRAADPNSARRRALDQALASGVISADEHAAKLAVMTAEPLDVTKVPARSRSGYMAILATVLLLPALAIVTYAQVGRPQALDPAARQAPASDAGGGIDMEQALAGLIKKLEENPSDGQGWALLARAYQSMQRPTEALDAVRRAHALLPDDPDLMAEYAQLLVMAGGKDFSGEPSQLLDRALAIQPNNQRALWLRGVADYQAGEYATAIATWTRLQAMLAPGSAVATRVQEQIAEARAKAGMPAETAQVVSPPSGDANTIASKPAGLTISIAVDPDIAAKVDPAMTVFVFARAVEGPPMPLAIQRATVSDLPMTLTLDDSNGMLPNMKLSGFPRVIVGARISRSGDPIAKAGDWQTFSEPIDQPHDGTIILTINDVVP